MKKKIKPHEEEGAKAIRKHWSEAEPDDRLAHLVKDATRSFLRALQVRLATHDVSLGHWTFLRILWKRDGVTQRELSIEAGVMEPTTVTALRSMEAVGYIERKQRPDNKKNMYVHLTPLGRSLKEKLVPLAEEVNAVAVDGISSEAVLETRKVLLRIIENLTQDEG